MQTWQICLLTVLSLCPASIRLYVHPTVWKQSRNRFLRSISSHSTFIWKASQEARPHVIHPCRFHTQYSGLFIVTGLRGGPLGTVSSKTQPDRWSGSMRARIPLGTRIPTDAPSVVPGPQLCGRTPVRSFHLRRRICFHVFARSTGKRSWRLLRECIRNPHAVYLYAWGPKSAGPVQGGILSTGNLEKRRMSTGDSRSGRIFG